MRSNRRSFTRDRAPSRTVPSNKSLTLEVTVNSGWQLARGSQLARNTKGPQIYYNCPTSPGPDGRFDRLGQDWRHGDTLNDAHPPTSSPRLIGCKLQCTPVTWQGGTTRVASVGHDATANSNVSAASPATDKHRLDLLPGAIRSIVVRLRVHVPWRRMHPLPSLHGKNQRSLEQCKVLDDALKLAGVEIALLRR